MTRETNSIIGVGSKPKIIRNKISHANLFYDYERKVVVAGNQDFTIEEFTTEFCRLLKFAVRWIEVSVGTELEKESDVVDLIKNKIKDTFNELSKLFLRIERSPELRKKYGNLIIKWRKECEG